jgi:outer membrane biosynthesis protein TonB
VIDTEGNVVEMQVISGPPLLIHAALDAVRQWKYEPTYLNDQPIAVQLIVTVTFQLSQ